MSKVVMGDCTYEPVDAYVAYILFAYPALKYTCSRKEVPILVERHSHDAVSRVESLLHAITMVDINVYI